MPLTYLLKIAHRRFPIEVTSALEIKRVSVLKATGLIEARISHAAGEDGTYRKAEIATVFAITAQGREQLFAMRDGRMQAPESSRTTARLLDRADMHEAQAIADVSRSLSNKSVLPHSPFCSDSVNT